MMMFAICSFISQISLAQGISIDQYKKKLMVTESRKIAKKNKVFDITATFLSPRFRIADAYEDWEATRLTEDQIKIEEDKLIAKIRGEDRYLVSVTFKLLKGVSPKRLPVPDEFDKYVFLENDQGDFVKAELLQKPSINRIGAEDRAVFLFSFPKNKPDGTPFITDNTKYRKVVFTNLGDLGEDEARWQLPVKPPYAPLEIAGIMEKTGLVEPRVRDSQMRLGIEIIRAAINSYAIDHRGKFPLSIDTATLGKYLLNEKIPENPYLKRPMRNSKNIGDFTYTVSKDRTSYSLKGNYHGDVAIKLPTKVEKPTNVALGKPVSVTTNGAEDSLSYAGKSPSDITDGSLDYRPASDAVEDGCIGWSNDDYNETMVITITIDLQETYNIRKIRYHPGNVQRAETWNADIMESPFGRTPTNPGSPHRGAWAEQTGSITASKVTIKLEKTRRSYATNWLFIGEIEVWGTPI